jgi:hypothetical protein
MKLTNRTQKHKVSKKVLLKNGAKKKTPRLWGALYVVLHTSIKDRWGQVNIYPVS